VAFMRSHATAAITSGDPVTISVQRNECGSWEVELPADHARVTCETLDEIRRVAYLRAAHTRSCELVIQDAYQRVIGREAIDGHHKRTDISGRSYAGLARRVAA
jgi:hypothetical protein